jgi:hypothetical protein
MDDSSKHRITYTIVEKHLSDASLQDRFLALITNIRIGLKGLSGTNTLAYYEHSLITVEKVL